MSIAQTMKNIISVSSFNKELLQLGLAEFEKYIVYNGTCPSNSTFSQIVVFTDASVFMIDNKDNSYSYDDVLNIPKNIKNALIADVKAIINK